VGFSKNDSAFGHSLVRQFRDYDSWSTKQLTAAIKLAHKYRRQYQMLIGIKLPPFTEYGGYDFGFEMSPKYLDTPAPITDDTQLETEEQKEKGTVDDL